LIHFYKRAPLHAETDPKLKRIVALCREVALI